MTAVRVNNTLELLTYPENTGLYIADYSAKQILERCICRVCTQMRIDTYHGAWEVVFPHTLTINSYGVRCRFCMRTFFVNGY